MKSSGELKLEAKQMLQGRWKDAVLMNLIPTVIGIAIAAIIIIPLIAIISGIALFSPDTLDTVSNGMQNSNGDVSWTAQIGQQGGGIISGLLTSIFVSGMSWTFLDIYRGKRVDIHPMSDIFRAFKSPYLVGVVCIYLLSTIFIGLWSLLFLIPGIVKSYSYSQANFIYYDILDGTGQKPGYLECITASRRLMNGYKGQLFWLDLSFIGWHILAVLTCGIGYLWLNPYIYATKAAFYNNLPNEAETF